MSERHHCARHNLLHDGPDCPRCLGPRAYPASNCGKQLFINGMHAADCATEEGAKFLVRIINQFADGET